MAEKMVLIAWKVGRLVGCRLVAVDFIVRQIDGTDMMVLVGPLGLILIGGMRYQLAACYTFHMHACMAAASLRWVLDLVRIGLDARQEGYQ